MAETINISTMAELISTEIFEYLGWRITGPTNENYDCVEESHGRKTHPADVVFAYNEPYEDKITHILCDLKSYSKDSINAKSLKEAIENLNESLTCARRDINWKNKYVFTDKNINIKAMLFIYNHDLEYDKDFQSVFIKATEKVDIDKGNIISVIGPQKILYLANICANITRLRGKKELPDTSYGFYYPEQLVRNIFHEPWRLPLTVEQLGGSFHILRYSNSESSNVIDGLDVYMEDKIKEFENFQHLFDYLRKYNCIHTANKIRIYVPFSKPSTRTNYDKALNIYEETVDKHFAEELKKIIHYEHTHKYIPQFFSQEIGGRHE